MLTSKYRYVKKNYNGSKKDVQNEDRLTLIVFLFSEREKKCTNV